MKTLSLTLLGFLSLTACGQQLVEFPLGTTGDANRDDARPGDAAGDAGADADQGALPTVISTSPDEAATNVSVTHRVTATFSRPMDPATLTTSSFTVRQGATTISGTVSYAGNTATFLSDAPLSLSLEYTGTITTAAADPQGAALATDYTWRFTTGACSQAPVALLSAASYAVLAGSTVTNTGPTELTGDLGVSPGTAVVGFPPGTLTGTMHAGDAAAAQAQLDLTAAFNDAAGRTLCPIIKIGNIGGLTLTPGLYKSTSGYDISGTNLILDAQGDADAVFIFQMATTLTTSTGLGVTLTNGATARNVFWQVGSSAVFGTNSAFKGTVMADQAITLPTGASLDGRALARIGGITLDANTIVAP